MDCAVPESRTAVLTSGTLVSVVPVPLFTFFALAGMVKLLNSVPAVKPALDEMLMFGIAAVLATDCRFAASRARTVMLAASPLSAQGQQSGAVGGRVSDADRLPLPGVTVTAKSKKRSASPQENATAK